MRIKRNDEHFVICGQPSRNFTHHLKALLEFVLQAAADIDQNSNTDWYSRIVREKRNLLLLAVFEDLKIIGAESFQVITGLIDHRCNDVDQLNVNRQNFT